MENKNLFIVVMFPYPSGSGLHVGHAYNYLIVDSYCRLQRYKGNSVFQPFGYDAFGLPAENYARKVGRNPKDVTYENISNFREEMARMNTSFEERLITCEPYYIQRTQWLFTQLKDRGLAYKAFREQEYCPQCETVLAKEQVKDGRCERCDAAVEKKELEQWFFRITDYKQRLIEGLERVDYPEKTKKQQRQWLEHLQDWCVSRQRKWGCPIPIEGEIDTLDTFVDSSFYTIEYDRNRPVDVYVGGNEHACMHLIYARFITKFLYDIGYISFDEPFTKVIHQGMITYNGQKMSKSKGNTISIGDYEPGHLRMYLMFINHYFEGGSWSDESFKGVVRFDTRMKRWLNEATPDGADINIQPFIDKVSNYFESWKTNKVISEWMIFYNQHKDKNLSFATRDRIRTFYEIIST